MAKYRLIQEIGFLCRPRYQGVKIKASKGQFLKGEAVAKRVGMVAVKTNESKSYPPCMR
jgi:hypothetical protein